ncbi:MAG: hypothetical protein ACTTKI_11415 [Tannerella sp.]|uniref:hypothetical protein n=1 Tax=Tannerella TaxID=195950 RepID=UPI0028F01D3B|nr:hypothetical protein [Tannerella forsythia]
MKKILFYSVSSLLVLFSCTNEKDDLENLVSSKRAIVEHDAEFNNALEALKEFGSF